MEDSNRAGKIGFDFRTFSILMLFSVIPMLIGTWYLFDSYENASLEVAGQNLSDTAETAFTLVNAYLQNQIISVASLAEVPVVREAADRGNRDLNKDLDAIRKAIPTMESLWPTLSRESPQLKPILDGPASQFLRRYVKVKTYYREVLVTDFFGRLVAATEKSPKYYFAHEEWWQETYGDGRRGSVYIGDEYYDATAQSKVMDIAQPLVNPDGGVVGAVKVVVDMQGIHALLGSLQIGEGRSVVLIRAKGEVISVPGYSSLEVAAYPATLDILTAREKGRPYFQSSDVPESMYGMSRRSFLDFYPHLNWIVVTSGKVDNIMGSLPQMRKYFMILLIVVFLLALFATSILSRVESKPVLEEDPHLERL